MQIQDRIIPLIEADYRNQQILRLCEWEKEFPDMLSSLSDSMGVPLVKRALDNGQWVMASFLLRRHVPNKIAQVQAGQAGDLEAGPIVIRAVVQDLDSAKYSMLGFLQERVRL
jgi:hypothetical protein